MPAKIEVGGHFCSSRAATSREGAKLNPPITVKRAIKGDDTRASHLNLSVSRGAVLSFGAGIAEANFAQERSR